MTGLHRGYCAAAAALVMTSVSYGHLPPINDASLFMGQTGFGGSEPKGSIRAETRAFSNKGEWKPETEYRGDYKIAQGDTVSYGQFNGKKLWWWAKFYAKGDHLQPGNFAPEGGTSPWVLINSLSAVDDGKVDYKWRGWNGDMDKMTGLKAEIPTWRDGAVGAYSFTHDDIGAMPFDLSVKPAWDLAKDYPEIKTCWGVYTEKMKPEDWDNARDMVLEGHEMFNHSMKHTSAADQWQWFYPGQKIPAHDPAIPEALRGLEVVGLWGDPSQVGKVWPVPATVLLENPLVAIKFTPYWTGVAPSTEPVGTNLGDRTVIEPVIFAKPGVDVITLESGQKQYVKYTKRDNTGQGLNEGFVAATGRSWFETAQVQKYGGQYWKPASGGGTPIEYKWSGDPAITAGSLVVYQGKYYKCLKTAPDYAPGTAKPSWVTAEQWEVSAFSPDNPQLSTEGAYVGAKWDSTVAYVGTKQSPDDKKDNGAPSFVAKVFCVKAWEAADYKVNVDDANVMINDGIYGRIKTAGEHFRKGKKSEYYGYPFDAYSEKTHDYLEKAGFVGARGGAKSGRPIPGDFFHPYRIDFDAFYITKTDWDPSKTGTGYIYPDNPHVLLGLNEMVDRIIDSKGYMIREFHAVADIEGDKWHSTEPSEQWPLNSAAKGAGGWWGGITKNMLKEHYDYLQKKIDAREITVFTVGEVTKYRMTANATKSAEITKSGDNYTLKCITTEDIYEKYRDEISVIVSLDQSVDSLGVNYVTVNSDWGMSPRRKPRKMDDAGKIWSVSINPFLGAATIVPNGDWNGQKTELTDDQVIGVKGAIAKSGIAAGFAGIRGGEISLRLPEGSYSVELFSAMGRKVGSAAVSAADGINRTGIKTDNLSTGVYYLNVRSKGVQVMPAAKIMIQ